MYPSYFYRKVTLKISISSHRKWEGGPNNFVKLPKSWVIYIEGNVY